VRETKFIHQKADASLLNLSSLSSAAAAAATRDVDVDCCVFLCNFPSQTRVFNFCNLLSALALFARTLAV
jgi:hypothetical protein